MNAVDVFTFTDIPVRVAIDNHGEPWFVAADICRVLGLSNTTMALRALDGDEKGLKPIETPGGIQHLNAVNESGMYTLIVRSDKPNAKPFRRWITHDVLPAIRKTGRYEATDSAPELPRSFAEALQLAADQARQIELQAAEIEAAAPMVAQAEQHRSADGLLAVGDFANELKDWAKREHGVKVKHAQVWDFLGELGLLIRGNTIRNNQRTSKAADRDFIRMKTTDFETNHGAASNSSPRLTIAGESYVWDRAVKRIAETGSLDKPGPKQITS